MVLSLRIALLVGVTALYTPAGARIHPADVRSAFVPVLIYHHVKAFKASDDAIERGLTIAPVQFASQVGYLLHHGFHLLTAAQMVTDLRTGHGLPRRPVVLTFDDGYADIYLNVYKCLLRKHLRATFFVVPDFLNTPRYLTWRQVSDMALHGMDIEAHSLTHPDLTTVNASRLRLEVQGSRQTLERRLKRTVGLFAYPYGAYDSTVLRAVAQAGFLAAFTTHEGWRQSAAAFLQSPRVYVDFDDSIRIFAGRLVADALALAADPT